MLSPYSHSVSIIYFGGWPGCRTAGTGNLSSTGRGNFRPFPNRNNAKGAPGPGFWHLWEDRGQAEGFLAFQQLDKFEGNMLSVRDFPDFVKLRCTPSELALS